MSAPSAANRLRTDFLRLSQDPVPYVLARPLPQNILEWHYVVRGPEKTPYEGGLYHGKLIFPKDYPFKPPAIYMLTPSGRFKTNTKLCLSISDFHPETWNPAWSVGTILTGLLSFLTENTPTLGSIDASDSRRQQLAVESHSFNVNDRVFCDLFPELAEECRRNVAEAKSQAASALAAQANGVSNRRGARNGGDNAAANDNDDDDDNDDGRGAADYQGLVGFLWRIVHLGPDLRNRIRSFFVNFAVFGALAVFLFFAANLIRSQAAATNNSGNNNNHHQHHHSNGNFRQSDTAFL